ncbi:hypothetical protein ACF07T_05585 [Streptomyces sp. NPDC015184]|uniref:hypothetical protein n=1 Tax=Streptomyces sp. NPDC015184 TaxID=3364946 RepID=UPI003700B4D1
MTHPPTVRTAPEEARAQPSVSVTAPGPDRRAPWSAATDRMRAAATTEPGRLRVIGAVLALLVVAFGGVTVLEVQDRARSANDVVEHSQPLSSHAADIFQSLAAADAAVTEGFLAGRQEPAGTRKDYDEAIGNTYKWLQAAASDTSASQESKKQITKLYEGLPRYVQLVERARDHNRQGFPLGGAYLRYANEQMTGKLLPAAELLYGAETERLGRDRDEARSWPFLSTGLGLVALGALYWAQRRDCRRTNRVFNRGLLLATAASTVVLLWLAAGHTVARSELRDADVHGQQSLDVLNTARISSLKARADENLALVARGSVLTPQGKDKYETDFTTGMAELDKQLRKAEKLAEDTEGRTPVGKALAAAEEWNRIHKAARESENAGDYAGARQKIDQSKASSYKQVGDTLEAARDHEEGQFREAAKSGRGALSLLPFGAALLALLGAGAAIAGVNRRVSEYR